MLKDWVLKIVGELIDNYVTEELIKKFEKMAKEYAYKLLSELADKTEWTEIDDALVEKLGKAWGVVP